MRGIYKFKIKFITVLLITITCFPLIKRGFGAAQPNFVDSLEELSMIQDEDFWVIYLKETHQKLVRLAPEVWQGNADIFHVEGSVRVGHFWSQFLMLSPGKWLTDRVESEGEHLTYFNVLINEGKIIWYVGTWRFRDYFNTTAEHFVWVQQNYTFHLVNVDMNVLNDIQDVGAVWVELMNDRDVYSEVISKTHSGIVQRNIAGGSGEHFLDKFTLDEEGWISLQGPLNTQLGSPALIMLESSHLIHPRWYDGTGIDNIELHLLDPRQMRTLNKGDSFNLQYLLVTGPVSIGHEWIDLAIEENRPIIELIKARAIKVMSNISCFANPAMIDINQSITIFGSINPPIPDVVVTLTYTKPDSSILRRTVTSGLNGKYSDIYTPSLAGSWSVQASWEGDLIYTSSTSQTVFFNVEETPLQGSLTIIVQEENENPIDEAKVSSISQPSGQNALTGISGADGSIVFTNVNVGEYMIQASKSGYETNFISITVLEGETTTQIIQLKEQVGILKIYIKDKDGNTLSGAAVMSTSQPSGQASLSGTTGSDGSVTFTHVKLGSYTLQASKTRYVTQTESVSAAAGETTELILTLEEEPSGQKGIPGFPYESIIFSLVLAVLILWLLKRRQ